jgi:hypothetical protein
MQYGNSFKTAWFEALRSNPEIHTVISYIYFSSLNMQTGAGCFSFPKYLHIFAVKYKINNIICISLQIDITGHGKKRQAKC